VAKILALLIQQNSHRDFRISLAAPTGKAAARLQESVKAAKSVLNCPDAVKKRIPEEASTLHRLLGAIPRSPYFRHDDQHRLTADCVVIDEASMVDLALFAKLVEALKADARLILLGDKDQLASVEAGAILGDICDAGRTHGYSTSLIDAYCRVTGEVAAPADLQDGVQGISDGIVELTKSYRFDETGGIGALSRAVNAGNAARALAVTQEGKDRDLDWKDLPPPDRLTSALEAWAVERFRGYLSTSDPGAALERQGRARILCALREGPYGVTHINAVVEKILIKNGLIGRAGKWYHGRPVMITKNDYSLGLYNGDMGIAMKDGDQGNALKVFFPGKDGPPRRFAPMALPEHETVYALTVHKSQGSEYDDVLFILSDWDAPILTRELIYTAVTRACRRIEIWGKKEIFLAAVNRRIQRSSGLRQSLWNMAAP
jgi:exodeoxyribonuclease V alpha subunit